MMRSTPAPTRMNVTWSNPTNRVRAFTLVELMVSVGILAGLMAMISMIFATATKSAGLAQTTTVVYRQLRQITEGLRRDLKAVDPSECVIGIAGVEVLAYRTPEDIQTDRTLINERDDPNNDYHRADVLMLVTKRKFEPYVYRSDPNAPDPDKFADVRHVVYGHANFGELNPDGTWMNGSGRGVEQMPASQWHLARRVMGFTTGNPPNNIPNNVGGWPLSGDAFTGMVNNEDEFADVFEYPWEPLDAETTTGIFKYRDTSLYFYCATSLDGEIFRYEEANGGTYYFLNQNDYKWYTNNNASNSWTRTQVGATIGPINSLSTGWPRMPAYFENYNSSLVYTPCWPEWFYVDGNSRTVLDPTPPVGRERRMAHYYLPACSEFHIEYTYDDPREIEIDRDPDSYYYGQPLLFDWNGIDAPPPRPVRWYSVPPGEKWICSKIPVDPGNYDSENGDLRDRTNPYRWPRAIRITITVYDPGGRLEEPISQTIIHTW